MSQHMIQYSTDPADCLEVVFALQKAAQQSHKAIAIVPPISQQTSNTALTADTSPKKAESPPLKIDNVWSLVEESTEQKTVGDKLSESSTQMAQHKSKCLENMTESNTEDADTCSASPVEVQNNVQQSDPSFDLSTVPVTEYTLEKLMDLVKSIEMAELSAGCPEKSESIFERVLKLYWNGKFSNMFEALKSFQEIVDLSKVYAKDYESVVFKSIETENLKKLAHCDILKHDAFLSPEEFRSSWLNVDGQPADIEKVLSEPLLDDVTMFKSLSGNTVVTSASLSVNSLSDMPEVSSKEKSVNPNTCSPTDLVMQKEGNDREEVPVENNGHSEGEKETFETQEDMNQNQKPSDISPSAERSTEILTDLSNAKEAFRQDQEQTCDNVSDSLSPNPGDSVSDGAKNSEVSTEIHCNSMATWQVEDISDDETPGNKEALNSSADTWLVEDISDDENPVSNETVNNIPGTCLLEDISDDEDSGNKEAVLNSSNALEVKDISENENPVVEDVSTDETSSNDSMFMGITVLSSEDARTFFHQFEKEPANKTKSQSNFDCFDVPSQPSYECNKATACSRCGTEIANSTNSTKMDSDADLFCLQCWEQAPLFELEEEPSSPMTDEADLLASPAKSKGLGQNYSLPCVKLEVSELTLASTKECTAYEALKGQKSDCLVKSELGEDCSPPFLKIEVEEPTVAPNEECIADEGQKSVVLVKSEQGHNCSLPFLEVKVLKTQESCIEEEQLMGQKRDSMVKSELVENCSPAFLELKVKKPAVTLTEECIADEELAGQKSVVLFKSERGHSCSPPSLEVKVLKTLETHIAEEQLTGQKRDSMVKSELVEKCSPSFELKIKKSVASTKECIADERQKSDCMMQSELRQNCPDVKMPKVSSPEKCIADEKPKRDTMAKSEMEENHRSPSLELKVKSNLALPKACIADGGLIGHKSDRMGESELGQNCSPLNPKLEVKEQTVASAEDCITNKGATREKSDGMLKPAERELTEIEPNKQKNTKNEKIKQCSRSFPKNTAFSKHKLKSGSTSTGSDDSVLFTPDVVVKMNWPRKKNPPGASGNKRRSSESQKCNKMKKCKEHRQERQDNPDTTNHRENPTEKVSGQSNDTPPHGSEKKLELHGILSVNKIKSTEPKKVRFDLYGSKTEKQCYARERRFSAPASLTVSDKDYTDVLSAKQKVLSQWSSTFIPKTKKTSPPRNI
ncbi:myotubularin-like protein [Labeo rohita]|uniref:Myotubularin-like protein n=1 Tax=Labeo rohita TaxID=84645 RepID=A0A498P3T8_LABRO|nr:myotubularin-like protein [Labeo rohita]